MISAVLTMNYKFIDFLAKWILVKKINQILAYLLSF